MFSAARLQRILPDAVLVGGTASAIHAEHRFSRDADHVLTDLRHRFNEVSIEISDDFHALQTEQQTNTLSASRGHFAHRQIPANEWWLSNDKQHTR